MGAIGYATQSGSYFAALERIDASLLTLILYLYPVLVMIGRGRARAGARSGRRVAALLLALAGILLVLVGAASGSLDWLGAALGLTLGARLHGVHPHRRPGRLRHPAAGLTALVCCGATMTYAVASVAARRPDSSDFGADRLGLAGRARAREHGRRDHLLLRRPGPGRAVGRVDPVDPGAGRHGRAGGGGVR